MAQTHHTHTSSGRLPSQMYEMIIYIFLVQKKIAIFVCKKKRRREEMCVCFFFFVCCATESHVEANIERQEMIKLLFRSFKLAFHQENFSTNSFQIPATLAHSHSQTSNSNGEGWRRQSCPNILHSHTSCALVYYEWQKAFACGKEI